MTCLVCLDAGQAQLLRQVPDGACLQRQRERERQQGGGIASAGGDWCPCKQAPHQLALRMLQPS